MPPKQVSTSRQHEPTPDKQYDLVFREPRFSHSTSLVPGPFALFTSRSTRISSHIWLYGVGDEEVETTADTSTNQKV